MGLPRPLRLTNTHDFARIRAQGRTERGRLLLVNVAPNGLQANRYGIVTSKRLGGAVVRNRVRRLLREAIRAEDAALQRGWDVVIVAHPAAAGLPLVDLHGAYRTLIEQAGLLHDEDDSRGL
ncbi:MAG: ribonuclease P protein component [Chloroflexi bacterium]|nr:MAG: ribonuclease P protein component [Chloroflexi bacterium OLB13]MBV6436997.1 Ribonuclease P protein component [Anaerolineae bacterium]MCC6565093.1 ribonuclease P protein component [Chloroflexota bacterium]MBW7877693.1 ribonuclease P protein component [Anaerolineae bacterium]MCO6444153.1 ribonuclease P protein component [Anaerolineae bacterium]